MAQWPAWRLVACGLFLAAGPAAQTELVSKATGGAATASGLSLAPALTPDGRCIAFASEGQDLVGAGVDSNLASDVYLVERDTGTVQRISVDTQGSDPDAASWTPRISRSGRHVAFLSDATDLVPGDGNGFTDVFVRDRLLGSTTRVSVGPGGVEANLPSIEVSLSGSGRLVAFMSVANNLVAADGNGQPDIFLHDLQSGVTQRISQAPDGGDANAESRFPVVSQDGRWVAFESRASNLGSFDNDDHFDVYLFDRLTGRMRQVSTEPTGKQANNNSFAPSLSANGRWVAFSSDADNLGPLDTNKDSDIYVCDMRTGTVVLASATAAGVQGSDDSETASLSADGRFVGFDSQAQNLAPAPGPLVVRRVFLKDLATGAILDAGVAPDGSPGNAVAGAASVARHARVLAFHSESTNLVAEADQNQGWDVFVRKP